MKKESKYFLLWYSIFRMGMLIIFFMGLSTLNAKVNDSDYLDGLWARLVEVPKDTSFLNTCLSLGNYYMDSSPDSGMYYFNQSFDEASKLDAKEQLGFSLVGKGEINIIRSNFLLAKKQFESAIELFEELNHKRGIAITNNHIGYVFWKLGNYKEGLKIYFKALKSAEEINDKKIIAKLCNDIGIIHGEQNDFNKSLRFYKKSLKIRKELNDKKGMCQAYNNIGEDYRSMGEHLKAIQYLIKGYELAKEIKYLLCLGITGANLGMTYSGLGEFKLANEYYDSAIEAAEKGGLMDTKIFIYECRSYTAIQQKKFKEGVEWGKKGIELSKKVDALFYVLDIYKNLADASDSLSNFKDAYHYHKMFKLLNDSLFNESNSKQIIEMQTKYDTEKKGKMNY